MQESEIEVQKRHRQFVLMRFEKQENGNGIQARSADMAPTILPCTRNSHSKFPM
jgi:hypothetical protein